MDECILDWCHNPCRSADDMYCADHRAEVEWGAFLDAHGELI